VTNLPSQFKFPIYHTKYTYMYLLLYMTVYH